MHIFSHSHSHTSSPHPHPPPQSSPGVESYLCPIKSSNSTASGSYLSRTISNSASATSEIGSYCCGEPHHLVSSPSGSIQLYLSLQEKVLYLPSTGLPSPSSYAEHDNGVSRPPTYDSRATLGLMSNFPVFSGLSAIPAPISRHAHHRHHPSDNQPGLPSGNSESEAPPAVLRGSLLMKLAKPTKIKSVSLKFYGRCKTRWLECTNAPEIDEIDPSQSEFQDQILVNAHHWEFLPNGSQDSDESQSLYGTDCLKLKSAPGISNTNIRFKPTDNTPSPSNTTSSFITTATGTIPLFKPSYDTDGNGDKSNENSTISSLSSKLKPNLLPAGEYIYNFTLAIDPTTPETVVCENGAIRYYLVPKIVRPGTFALNLTGHKEVELVRSPPSCYDTSAANPIAISRDWDNRLHYEIVVPKKHIPLGSSIPMAIKLTPLDKVQVHRVRVSIIENTEYICAQNTSIKHKDPPKKIVLYEKVATHIPDNNKRAGNNVTGLSSNKAGNVNVETTIGAENQAKLDNEKQDQGSKQKGKLIGNLVHFFSEESLQAHPTADPSEEASTHIDCTLPFLSDTQDWNNVPSHHFSNPAASSKYLEYLRPDSTHCPFLQIKHRLVISFRISKQDPTDVKRRYFEVLIDTPIHFLSKHCTTDSLDLPLYHDRLEDDGLYIPRLSVPEEYLPLSQVPSSDSSSFAPLVQTLSNPMVMSPPVRGFTDYFENMARMSELPSFTEAISQPRYPERNSDSEPEPFQSESSLSSFEAIPPPPEYSAVDESASPYSHSPSLSRQISGHSSGRSSSFATGLSNIDDTESVDYPSIMNDTECPGAVGAIPYIR